MEEKTEKELLDRLSEIKQERDYLDFEEYSIIEELFNRIDPVIEKQKKEENKILVKTK